MASASQATDVVLGDSLSARSVNWIDWPAIAFDDHVNLSINGYKAEYFMNQCIYGQCLWLDGAGPGQTWWILLGTNDLFSNALTPTAPPEVVAERIAYLVTLIEGEGVDEVNIIPPPPVFKEPYPFLNGFVLQLAQDLEPLCATHTCLDLSQLDRSMFRIEQGDAIHFNQDGHDEVARIVPEPDALLMVLVVLSCLARSGRREHPRPR